MILNKLFKLSSDIASGHINELLGFGKDISKIRLDICLKCPLYSPRLGGICDNNKWLNPETNEVVFEPTKGYIRGCGCRLKAKTTLANAECVAGKW